MVTPTFYYLFIIFLTCYISVPSFIYNLCYVLLLGNHLKHTPRHTYSLYSLYTSLFSSYCPSDFIPHRITIMFTIPQTRLPRNIQLFRKRLSGKMCTRQSRKVIAELRRAKRASGAPWVIKFGKPSIRENLVMT